MKFNGLTEHHCQQKVLGRVKEREYRLRCWRVNICPACGSDLGTTPGADYTCHNEDCVLWLETIPEHLVKETGKGMSEALWTKK